MADNTLDSIVGERLSSVEFVHSYVQLHFDGPTLTVFAYPPVELDRVQHTGGASGYRDALCSLITARVRAAVAAEGEKLCIEFEGGARIVVPLDYVNDLPEIAMFQDPTRGIAAVW
jgi:hypothetical protein